jgi:hypothetical protein
MGCVLFFGVSPPPPPLFCCRNYNGGRKKPVSKEQAMEELLDVVNCLFRFLLSMLNKKEM